LILGTGTDIIEIERIEKQISEDGGFKKKIFTQREIDYCESKFNKAQHYAVRFAAKEAFFKAIGTGMRDGMAFCEIEVINDKLGKPGLVLHGKVKKFAKKAAVNSTHVSLSHIKNFVNAIVILEK
jgi:holo-[acyl-carrier protein] synthase